MYSNDTLLLKYKNYIIFFQNIDAHMNYFVCFSQAIDACNSSHFGLQCLLIIESIS